MVGNGHLACLGEMLPVSAQRGEVRGAPEVPRVFSVKHVGRSEQGKYIATHAVAQTDTLTKEAFGVHEVRASLQRGPCALASFLRD